MLWYMVTYSERSTTLHNVNKRYVPSTTFRLRNIKIPWCDYAMNWNVLYANAIDLYNLFAHDMTLRHRYQARFPSPMAPPNRVQLVGHLYNRGNLCINPNWVDLWIVPYLRKEFPTTTPHFEPDLWAVTQPNQEPATGTSGYVSSVVPS